MCWHKWSQWETYYVNGRKQRHPFSQEMLPFTEKRQSKRCIKCGIEQDREVKQP